MSLIFTVSALYALSLAAYKLFDKINFPAARLIGPIIVIGLLQGLSGYSFEIPTPLKTLFSIVFGVYLGLRFNQKAVGKLKSSLKPALLISVIYLFITYGYGELIQAISPLDQTTAFLAVIPGGIAEASILGVSYNANLAQISAFQLVRFLSIVLIIPVTISWLMKSRFSPLPEPEEELPEPKDNRDSTTKEISAEAAKPFIHWLWLMVIGAIGAFAFKAIHFPAAYMLGATFVTSASILIKPYAFKKPPQTYYNLAQVGMGMVIGTSFTPEAMSTMGSLMLPMLVLTILVLLSSFVLGLLFMKLFKWDFLTAFLAVLPGGMSAMVVLADEFGSDVVAISTLQLVRLLTAVMIIPMLYQFIL